MRALLLAALIALAPLPAAAADTEADAIRSTQASIVEGVVAGDDDAVAAATVEAGSLWHDTVSGSACELYASQVYLFGLATVSFVHGGDAIFMPASTALPWLVEGMLASEYACRIEV